MNKKITKLALLGLAVVAVSGVTASLMSVGVLNTSASTNDSYSCADIVFGETFSSYISSKTDLTTKSQIDNVTSSYTGFSGSDFTLTHWSDNESYIGTYKNRTTKDPEGYNYYPLKLGTDNLPADVILTLVGKTCDKAIVYAVGWHGKTGVKLGVGGSDASASTSIAETPSGVSSWDFSHSYTFTFNSTSEIHFKSLTKTVLISKIVLRIKTNVND